MTTDSLCMGCMTELAGTAACACGWTEPREADAALLLKPRTVLGGQYLVGRSLGHGGFGIVYLGWDMNLQLKVAIKEYLPSDYATRPPGTTMVTPYSGSNREFFDYGLVKFLDEARAIARLNDHPGIVPVLNFFRENGTGYLVMSYIAGRTMKEYLTERGGRLPYAEAFALAMPVMDTLRAVHDIGLLHRDISPDNIYLADTRQVKLLDFGAARMALGDKSKSLSVILKAGYAPKEQYQSKGRQGPWTDVYAVGATMYRALTGNVPPDALDRNEEDELQLPRECGADMPDAAEAVLMQALAIQPEDRYQTIAEFQGALMSATGTLGTASSPRSTSESIPPPPRRVTTRAKRSDANDTIERVAVAVIPFAERVNTATAKLGLRPVPLAEASTGGAAIAAGVVGGLGAWSSLSNLQFASAMPGMFGAFGAVAVAGAVAGNLLLLLGAYLLFKDDNRGPRIAWAAAWTLAAIALIGYVLNLANFASMSGWTFAWQISFMQFSSLAVTLLMLAVVIWLLRRRRPQGRVQD